MVGAAVPGGGCREGCFLQSPASRPPCKPPADTALRPESTLAQMAPQCVEAAGTLSPTHSTQDALKCGNEAQLSRRLGRKQSGTLQDARWAEGWEAGLAHLPAVGRAGPRSTLLEPPWELTSTLLPPPPCTPEK